MGELVKNKQHAWFLAIGTIAVMGVVFGVIPRLFDRQQNPKTETETKDADGHLVKQTPIKELSVEKTTDEYPPLEGGDPQSSIDNSLFSWWYVPMPVNSPGTSIELKLASPQSIKEIDLLFAPDRYATDFAVYFSNEGTWVTVADVLGNKEPEQVKVTIDELKAIQTDKIKITFLKTSATDHLISLREVKVFQKL